MRKFLLSLLLFMVAFAGHASHILGGELGYEFVRKYNTSPASYVYKIKLKLYRDCNSNQDINNPLIKIFNRQTGVQITTITLTQPPTVITLPPTTTASCVITPPATCYQLYTFEGEIELMESSVGYTLSHATCCRSADITNIVTPNIEKSTYTVDIPPHIVGSTEFNSTPNSTDSVKVICRDIPVNFKFNFSDPDGDSLSYSFCNALGYNGSSIITYVPPFPSVNYAMGYSGGNPVGGSPPQLTIHPGTGVISGTITKQGSFVVMVCVNEWRNGVQINTLRKEFQFRVDSCSITNLIQPIFQNCNNLTITVNHPNDPNLIYKWDFGDAAVSTDTSSLAYPTYTYNRPDSYNVKMIVQRGLNCIDSAIMKARMFPGYSAQISSPLDPRCSNNLLLFKDSSIAAYGNISAWKWLIAFPASAPLVNVAVQDQFEYNFSWPTGNNNLSANALIKLISTSSVGCVDSTQKTIAINRGPDLDAGPNQIICVGDSIIIMATSDGNSFTWTPSTGLNNPSILQPTAKPTTNTLYRVETSNNGCVTKDSVWINVGNRTTAFAGADVVKCFDDSVQLNATGGQLFTWTPNDWLTNTTIANPISFAKETRNYVVAVIDTNGCRKPAYDTVMVRVVPKIDVFAGRDTFVKKGIPVQIRASGAQQYHWEPASLFSDPNVAAPYIPILNNATQFVVRGYTPEGCEDFDSVWVRILESDPDLFVPNAFSPNGDGRNDVFKPIGFGADYVELFVVYNRWGQQVFYSNKYGEGWNGTMNGKDQPVGTYVWILKGRDYTGRKIEKRGTVLLLR